MKLQPPALPALMRDPAKRPVGVLVYGPEAGRVTAVVQSMRKVLEAEAPLNIRKVTQGDVVSGEVLVGDELRSVSLLGDKTLLHITDATDSLTKHLDALERGENILVVQADSLGPRSSLRKLFEYGELLAAVACYVEEGRALESTIRTMLQEEGLQADAEAVMAIAAAAGANQLVLRQDINKLSLYKGSEDRQLRVADVTSCMTTAESEQQDAWVQAIFDGRKAAADGLLARLLDDGVQPIALLRALNHYALRLLAAQGQVQQGKSAEQALSSLKPPVFFKQKPVMQRHLQRWSPTLLFGLLERLQEEEVRLKSAAIPAAILMGYANLRALGASGRKR